MATRIEEVTILLNKIVDPIKQLNVFLQQERVSYELIRGDIESLLIKKQQLSNEISILDTQAKSKADMANEIIKRAKDDAKVIAQAINDRNANSIRILDEIKEYRNIVDRKKWQELKNKVSETVAA